MPVEVWEFLFACVVVACADRLIARSNGSQWPRARARSFTPHARQVTRSRYMAHPQEDPRA